MALNLNESIIPRKIDVSLDPSYTGSLERGMVMVFAALIAGIGLGVGSAVGVEFLGRNFKLEEQVEQYLELPVFAVIPDLSEIVELSRS